MTVSLIIPVWNGGYWLDELLTALARQTLLPDEILLVDSGSTDNSLSIIRRHQTTNPAIRLLEIPQQDFDHGGTRTWAAQQTSGEILICMSQDAIPAADDALERLVRPFHDKDRLAATYGRQLPAQDATLFSEHLRRFNYPEQAQCRRWNDRAKFGFKTIFISNSFAAWRREPLATAGYFPQRLLFGEDTLTLAKLLENGYDVLYVSEALVWHSHNYSIMQEARRYFDIGVLHAEEQALLRQFGGAGGAGRQYVRSELALLLARKKYQLLPEWFCRNAGKFIAYQLGRRHRLLPRSWAKTLSMNPGWQGWAR
ncbi:glycosyltransferase family 2 protein [Candidatus Electronema sp. JM]|uniref:glycosyltransferase family 2 protein n=1 Tax=Candidatus Electronema sp. JM TaxID=3401571 RepID=UPI003AA88C17